MKRETGNGKRNIIFFSFLLFTFTVFRFTASAKEPSLTIEDKIAIQTSLENKLKATLSEVLGTERIITSVSLELDAIKQEEKKEEEGGFVLPGVPARNKVGERRQEQALDLDSSGYRIKRLMASVVLDQATPAADIELAKRVASGVLGMNTARGDQLTVETMAFRKPAEASYRWKQLFVPPDLWKLLGMILLLAFIGVFFWTFPRVAYPLAASVREVASKMQSAPAAAGQEREGEGVQGKAGEAKEKGPEESMAGPSSSSVGAEAAPFDFLRPSHANALHFLLKREKPETIAVILHYAPSAMASGLMARLPGEVQAAVCARLAVTQEEDPARVRDVESQIKTKIQYLVGGQDKVESLLGEADPGMQKQLLEGLARRNANLAARLKSNMVFVEDIHLLERPGLQLLIRRVPVAALARVLKSMSGNGMEGILSKLPEGVSERLKQEIELADTANKQQISADQKRVLEVLRMLQKEGHLAKAAAAAAVEPAAEEGGSLDLGGLDAGAGGLESLDLGSADMGDLGGLEMPGQEPPKPEGA